MYSDRASFVELKMSEDGPVQVEVFGFTRLHHPPNATMRVQNSQTHDVLKCWILLVSLDK